MTSEQDNTLKALQIAIQMEIDGKEYYLKASRESSSKLGEKLLKSLAVEEDVHRQKFRKIYNAIRRNKAWPATDFQPDGGKRLRTIFAQASEEIGYRIKPLSTELDAVQTAISMEDKSQNFYTDQGSQATYEVERAFYTTLATEETEHRLILLDYYEYLKDPASWFVMKEHSSLDGG